MDIRAGMIIVLRVVYDPLRRRAKNIESVISGKNGGDRNLEFAVKFCSGGNYLFVTTRQDNTTVQHMLLWMRVWIISTVEKISAVERSKRTILDKSSREHERV